MKEEMEMLNTRRVNRSQGRTAASEGGGHGLRGAEGGGKKRLFDSDELPASLGGPRGKQHFTCCPFAGEKQQVNHRRPAQLLNREAASCR